MERAVILLVASTFLCSCGMMGAEDTPADGGADPTGQDDCDGDDCGPADEDPGDVDDEPVFVDTVVPDGLEYDGFCDHAPTAVKCMDHKECDDNIYCNGEERCGWFSDAYYCYQSSCYPCDDAPGGDFTCRPGVCLEDQKMCSYPVKDIDEDGYEALECGGSDCDDASRTVHPGAADACDGLDNDCDDLADEDAWKAAETPLRASRDGSNVLDAAMGALADKWVVAWVDALGERTSICVGRYGPEDLGSPAASAPCFDTAGPAGGLDIAVTGSSDFYVFWVENSESIKARRLWYDGSLKMGDVATIYGPEPSISDIDVAAEPDDGHAGIFFKSDRTGNFEIHMMRASLPGLVPAGEALRVSRAVGFSGHPSAAAGPEAYGVAWQDDRDGNMKSISRRSAFRPAARETTAG
ncbi:MAG: putative metal-binding motif-containing protein [Pseudomonadota bacterium]